MGEVEWKRARLFPVSGIGGADEQERREASALLAVVQSVREFGARSPFRWARPPALSACIEVPFTDGDKKLRPDGLVQVVSGGRTWTALEEVKTGQHELIPGQIDLRHAVGPIGLVVSQDIYWSVIHHGYDGINGHEFQPPGDSDRRRQAQERAGSICPALAGSLCVSRRNAAQRMAGPGGLRSAYSCCGFTRSRLTSP